MIEILYIALFVFGSLLVKVFFDLDRLKEDRDYIIKEVTQTQKDITNLNRDVEVNITNLNRDVEVNNRWLNSLVIEVNKLKTSKVITIDNVELPKDFGKVETGEIKVNNLHDGHYKALGIEPWGILKANMTYEEYKGFLKGNIQKYLHRNKEGLKDYEKLANYANKLVKEVSEHDNNTNNNG